MAGPFGRVLEEAAPGDLEAADEGRDAQERLGRALRVR